MEFKDYYTVLGVSPDADAKDIKTAYRKLARQYHPDMNPDEGAEAKFKEVAEAYEVLKDESRRAEFDELRQYGQRSSGGFEPPPGWQRSDGYYHQGGSEHSQDFSDFFNSIFGGSGREYRFSQEDLNRQVKGQDIDIELPVFLEDIVNNSTRTIEYRIPVIKNGQVSEEKKQLKVKIPQGVIEGERIRVKGQGMPGVANGPVGDLYLHVRLVPHPLFDVQGHNLTITLPLSPWEAALGTRVTIPTLTGKVNMTIPPNTQSGKKFRIKDKGLKNKAITGDLFAVVKVVMPPTTSEKENKLWKELAQATQFDPRQAWSDQP